MSKTFKIVLDPGHRRENRGGVLFNEGENNFRHAHKLKKELEKYEGLKVYITRSHMNEDPSLYQRATMYGKADLFISIHTNAASPDARGVEIIDSYNSHSNILAQRHVNLIAKTLNIPNRGLKYSYYNGKGQQFTNRLPLRTDFMGVLRNNPSTNKYLVEYIFHTNRKDSEIYLKKQDELIRAEAQLIASYYGKKKKNGSKPSIDKTNALFLAVIWNGPVNIRKSPSTKAPIVGKVNTGDVYTITEEKSGFGKLKSGAGWISLSKNFVIRESLGGK